MRQGESYYSVLRREAFRVREATDAERNRFRELLNDAVTSDRISFKTMVQLEGIAFKYSDVEVKQ